MKPPWLETPSEEMARALAEAREVGRVFFALERLRKPWLSEPNRSGDPMKIRDRRIGRISPIEPILSTAKAQQLELLTVGIQGRPAR